MKEKTDLSTDTQHRKNVGILMGMVLITALTVIALLVLRPQIEGSYQVPPETGDGWVTASPHEVGMDEEPIRELLANLAQQNEPQINSLLVVKDGKLILETYYPGFDITPTDNLAFTRKDFGRDTMHCLASASKSVTSILFGMAVDQGKIADVDEKMFASFPDYAGWNYEGKDEITLKHLLTMTAGLAWDETSYPYNDARNDLNYMTFVSPDPIRYMLIKRLTSKPGEVFLYSSGITNLLGEIVNRKTGMPMVDYARGNLFHPLGITSYQWRSFESAPQMAVASSLLYLRPRDMAKIGQLYLQQGIWEGKQIVSPQWVQESTAQSVPLNANYGPDFNITGYGYQWWRGRFANGQTNTFYAAGWGGQFIIVMPKINTVVVTTGSNYDYSADYSKIFGMINRYILGSIYSDL